MRYVQIPTISFTDVNGKSYPIKDIRPIPSYTIKTRVYVSDNDKLDEIASRTEIYGPQGYRNAYKLFDANVVKLVENCLDIGKVRSIEVPV